MRSKLLWSKKHESSEWWLKGDNGSQVNNDISSISSDKHRNNTLYTRIKDRMKLGLYEDGDRVQVKSTEVEMFLYRL